MLVPTAHDLDLFFIGGSLCVLFHQYFFSNTVTLYLSSLAVIY